MSFKKFKGNGQSLKAGFAQGGTELIRFMTE